MSLETVVAGAYVATYDAVNTGFTQNGYTLSRQGKQELINQSDLYGDTIIDMVYRGGDTFIEFMSRVYKAGSITPWWPWGETIGTLWTVDDPIARLASDVAATFALVAVTGTPAAAKPATLTGTAILAPGYNTSLLFDSRCRNVPIRLVFIPEETNYDYVVSIQTGNVDKDIDDRAWFIPLLNTSPSAWSNAVDYLVGNYVSSGGQNYLCLRPNINKVPPNTAYWIQLTTNPTGDYDPITIYGIGDDVSTPGNSSGTVFTLT